MVTMHTLTERPLNSNFCPAPAESDADGDSVLDFCDNCRHIFNMDREDTDLDRVGDVCDNCPFLHNPAQLEILQEISVTEMMIMMLLVCFPMPSNMH